MKFGSQTGMAGSFLKHKVEPLAQAGIRLSRHTEFIKNFVLTPRRTGSICPSSRFLSRGMVGAVPRDAWCDGKLVIDLGSGTGVMTERMLCSGIPVSAIVAVECNKTFAAKLRHRFPRLLVVDDDARFLHSLMAGYRPGQQVGAVVSSLPLRNMPHCVTFAIMEQVKQVLAPTDGVLVQFSYAVWMKYPLTRYGLIPQRRFTVLRNVPPATVEVYKVPRG